MLDRDVSGRDLKIISEALYIAIPFMLKHTMSASNTRDMIRIMEYIDKDFGFFSHLKRQELMRADIKGKTKILQGTCSQGTSCASPNHTVTFIWTFGNHSPE